MKKQSRLLILTIGFFLIIGGLLFIRSSRSPGIQTVETSADAETQLFLTAQASTIQNGQEFIVQIRMNPGKNSVIMAEPHISFDPSYLTLLSMNQTPAFPNVVSSPEISEGKGTISVASESVRVPVTTISDVVTLRFKALRSGSTQIDIDETSFVGSLAQKKTSTNMLKSYNGIDIRIQ